MINIKYMGYHSTHEEFFRYHYPQGIENYLLIVSLTDISITIDDETNIYPANTAILYPPFTPISYCSAEQIYINNWIQFTTQDDFILNFTSPGTPLHLNDPDYCDHIFRLLSWEEALSSETKKVNTTLLVQILISKLSDSIHPEIPSIYSPLLVELRKEIKNNPQLPWTVNTMANKLHISTGYLQALYKNMFCISCMEDVIQSRITLAKLQLTSTSMSIAEISEFCGYKNVEHFCRQFRSYCHCTPLQFRKNKG